MRISRSLEATLGWGGLELCGPVWSSGSADEVPDKSSYRPALAEHQVSAACQDLQFASGNALGRIARAWERSIEVVFG